MEGCCCGSKVDPRGSFIRWSGPKVWAENKRDGWRRDLGEVGWLRSIDRVGSDVAVHFIVLAVQSRLDYGN